MEALRPIRIPRAERVRLELGAPKHGWLPFRLVLDDFELEALASGVCNDPLEELIDMGVFLARGGSGMRRVCLWLEPAGFAVDAWNLGDEFAELLVSRDDSFVPPMSACALEEVRRYSVDRRTLARCVEEEVARLLRDHEPALLGWSESKSYGRLHAGLLDELSRGSKSTRPGYRPQ